ncbi:Protein with carboxyl methyl esterase activity [Entomortierella lignicola]|nr:Protein with carboxyl methyl esterase activity [Entomortierella lignicola]
MATENSNLSSIDASAKTAAVLPDNQDLSPLDWTAFFETKRQVSIPAEMDSSNITFTVYEINRHRTDLPVIVLHHGAGHCALSFAVTARELRKLVGEQARILSLDVRGHGETTSNDQFNLDIDRLAKDLQNLLVTLYTPSSSASEGASAMPELFLVGHSMGGAVVTEVATRELVPNISGFAVLDMQEASEHFWLTWFDHLNGKFLSAKPKKLLILGGHGFFDDEMKAAHEQNKFKYSIFTDSGHAVQEDDPVRMAKELVEFWKND